MRLHRILLIVAVAVLLAAADGLRASRRFGILKPVAASSKTSAPAATSPVSDNIDAARILELVNAGDAVVIDARARMEYDVGHIPYAQHMPLATFMAGKPQALEFYNPDQLFVVYCDGGDCEASEKVKQMLTSYNFTNVRIFRAGWPGWLDFKGPIETTKLEPP